MRHVFILALFIICVGPGSTFAVEPGGGDVLFRLSETTTPLAVRQEKAIGLLRAIAFEAGGLYEQFLLNNDSDLAKVQQALDTLLEKSADSSENRATISTSAQHYLTWAVARAQMLNRLDFSETSLRHFYRINPKQYPCSRTAKVSELIIPDTYLDSLGSTAALVDIKERLKHEEFAKVSYEITGMLGEPDTGFKGDVTEKSVGAARFNIYAELWRSAQLRGIEGADIAHVTGGPYKVPGGYLFVQMLGFSDGQDGCYDFYRDQVARDYGREWLKKIYGDTLTTAARELRPTVNDFTTGTATSAIAYIVGGHRVSFAEARATLPFLFGNEQTAAFWQSIQRQALEVELIYHGSAGKAARETPEYNQLIKMLASISEAKDLLEIELQQELTTGSLEKWFRKNRSRFTVTTTVSYVLYKCNAAATGSDNAARCAAALQKLRDKNQRASASDIVTSKSITNAVWDDQSREIQVACQNVNKRKWSQVFSMDGRPFVLYLQDINRREPTLTEVLTDVRVARELELRHQFWKRFAGLSEN